MKSNRSYNSSTFNAVLDAGHGPLPSEVSPEQAAAIKHFGDCILESLGTSERLRREQAALHLRASFQVVR